MQKLVLIGETMEAALIGGLSNLLSGKTLFNAVMNTIGNLASQVDDPCFSGFKFKQAAAAGALGAYNLGARLPYQPNLLSSTDIAIHAAGTQKIPGLLLS